jgi:rod shape-determining protein MreD
MTNDNRRRVVIALSFVVAFILASITGPAWLVGLLLDVVYGSLLGQHALAKTLVAFLVLKLHLRIRIFPAWQQALVVGLILAINHIIIIWVRSMSGQADAPGTLWFTIIVGTAIWPPLYNLLRKTRRRYT